MAHYYSSAGYYEEEKGDDRVLMTCSKELLVSRVMADVQDYHGLCLSLGTAELSCVVHWLRGYVGETLHLWYSMMIEVLYLEWHHTQFGRGPRKLFEMVAILLEMCCCIGHLHPG